MLKTKQTELWTELGYQYKGLVEYGINIYGDFTIYASVYRRKNGRGRWILCSDICSNTFIQEKFPELLELCQFNRIDSATGERLHYYWLSWRYYCAFRGWIKNDYPQRDFNQEEKLKAWQSFQDIALLDGAERLPDIQSVEQEKKFHKWLKSRLPKIHKNFWETMKKFDLID